MRNWVSDTAIAFTHLERRIDPFFRPAFDALFQNLLARVTTGLINLQRPNEGLKIAEERPIPNEEAYLESIISSFKAQMALLWKPGGFERGGNTKTHGVCPRRIHRARWPAGEPAAWHLREAADSYRAWVRFSGPGPYVTPDIDDVGFMSISIKLMGVPGAKLMDEEKFTQDMFGVSTPTFVTPDTRANAQLQIESITNAQIFYFVNLGRSHILDFIMQALWLKTQSSPFEAPYFSCVPYLLGEGQAMQYSVWPKSTRRTPIPRLPFRPPDDYLRDAMVGSLSEGDVEFDIRVAAADRPTSDADRKQLRALAGTALTPDIGGHVASAAADIHLPSADGVFEAAVLQPVALAARASAARESEPRPPAHVSGTLDGAAHHERGPSLRADRGRGV